MLCRSCKFDNGDTAVFCGGCGADLTPPVSRPERPRSRRRLGPWLGAAIAIVVTSFVTLAFVLDREAASKAVLESSASGAPRAADRPEPAIASSRQRKDGASNPGSLDRWPKASYAARLTFAADYVTWKQGLVRSTEELKDTAVRLERCISEAAAGPRGRAASVHDQASACYAQLSR